MGTVLAGVRRRRAARGGRVRAGAAAPEHTAGAILAYTLDAALRTLTGAAKELKPGSKAEVDLRYRLALRYQGELREAAHALTGEIKGAALLEPVTTA